MNIYKTALTKKLRFETQYGNLTTEQLFDLKIEQLDKLAIELQEESEKTTKKSFLVETTDASKLAKLKFDVAFDVLATKLANKNKALKAAETKAHNQKIMELIEKKKNEQLGDLSVEELQALLK